MGGSATKQTYPPGSALEGCLTVKAVATVSARAHGQKTIVGGSLETIPQTEDREAQGQRVDREVTLSAPGLEDK